MRCGQCWSIRTSMNVKKGQAGTSYYIFLRATRNEPTRGFVTVMKLITTMGLGRSSDSLLLALIPTTICLCFASGSILYYGPHIVVLCVLETGSGRSRVTNPARRPGNRPRGSYITRIVSPRSPYYTTLLVLNRTGTCDGKARAPGEWPCPSKPYGVQPRFDDVVYSSVHVCVYTS